MTEVQTEPFDEGTGSKKGSTPVSIRFEDEMLRRIDERRAQAPGGLNRSAWVTKALDWVLTNLPTGLAHPERDRVASEAPPEVTGSKRLPPAPHQHRWTTVRETGEHLCPDCGEVRKAALKPGQPRTEEAF